MMKPGSPDYSKSISYKDKGMVIKTFRFVFQREEKYIDYSEWTIQLCGSNLRIKVCPSINFSNLYVMKKILIIKIASILNTFARHRELCAIMSSCILWKNMHTILLEESFSSVQLQKGPNTRHFTYSTLNEWMDQQLAKLPKTDLVSFINLV